MTTGPVPPTSPLLNPLATACARLGIGRTKMWQLAKSGELRLVRIGSRAYVAEAELQRFVERLQTDRAA